jgi:hypothetical protein
MTPDDLRNSVAVFAQQILDDVLQAEEIACVMHGLLIKGYMVIRTYPEHAKEIAEWMVFLHQVDPPSVEE